MAHMAEGATGQVEDRNSSTELDSLFSALEGTFCCSSGMKPMERVKYAQNFQVLVDLFLSLRKCLFIAYNNAVAVGNSTIDIDVEFGLYEISLETARLCWKSVIYLGKCEDMCREAVSNTVKGYSYLSDGDNKLASITFQTFSKRCSAMVEDSQNLSKCFDHLSSNVRTVLDNLSCYNSKKEATLQDEKVESKGFSRNDGSDISGNVFAPTTKPESVSTPTSLVEPIVMSSNGKTTLDAEGADFEVCKDNVGQATKFLNDALSCLNGLSAWMMQTAQFWNDLKMYFRSVLDQSDHAIEVGDMALQKKAPISSEIRQLETLLIQFCKSLNRLHEICGQTKRQLERAAENFEEDGTFHHRK